MSFGNFRPYCSNGSSTGGFPLRYKGTWDSSTGVLPAGTDGSYYFQYLIVNTNTIGGVIYRAGDLIVWNGTQFDIIDANQNIVNKYTEIISLTANTPLTITHNLGVTPSNGLLMNFYDGTGMQQAFLQLQNFTSTTVTVLSNTTATLTAVFIG